MLQQPNKLSITQVSWNAHNSAPPAQHSRLVPWISAAATVSVVIPALNEAKNLPHVLPRIPAWVDEVLVIPGHSTDDTEEVARALWPSVRIVEQHGRGKGAALRSGFAAATGDIIVMMDADGSMNAAEIPAYVGALLAGADFAKGTALHPGRWHPRHGTAAHDGQLGLHCPRQHAFQRQV